MLAIDEAGAFQVVAEVSDTAGELSPVAGRTSIDLIQDEAACADLLVRHTRVAASDYYSFAQVGTGTFIGGVGHPVTVAVAGQNVANPISTILSVAMMLEYSTGAVACPRKIDATVAAIIPYDTEADALRLANDSDYGLAAGIWKRDSNRAFCMADKIQAGTVYINNYFNASTQSPVGGFKQSGYGRENGFEGMRCFLQTKSVWLATSPHQPGPFPLS